MPTILFSCIKSLVSNALFCWVVSFRSVPWVWSSCSPLSSICVILNQCFRTPNALLCMAREARWYVFMFVVDVRHLMLGKSGHCWACLHYPSCCFAVPAVGRNSWRTWCSRFAFSCAWTEGASAVHPPGATEHRGLRAAVRVSWLRSFCTGISARSICTSSFGAYFCSTFMASSPVVPRLNMLSRALPKFSAIVLAILTAATRSFSW